MTVAGSATGIGALGLHDNDANATGTMEFQGNLGAASLVTVARGYAVRLLGLTIAVTADANFLNTGALVLGDGAGDTLTFTGGLDTTTGPGGTSMAGTVQTTNTQMDLGNVTMTAAATLRSGSGAINVASVTDGAGSFVLSLGSAVQTGAITVSGNATFNTLATFAGAYAVAFTGTTTTVDVDANFLNTGSTTLGDQDTDILTFTGGLGAASAGGVSAAGAIRTAGQQIDLGAVSLGANTTIDSSNNGGSATGAIINIASVTGATHDLALISRTGAVTVAGRRDGHRSAWPA